MEEGTENLTQSIGVLIDLEAPLFTEIRERKALKHTDFKFKLGEVEKEFSVEEIKNILGF